MAKTIRQSSSANIHIGPILNISASVMVTLEIANNAIVLIKENGASAQRNATTSALSVGPGMYRIVVNTADTDTLGAMDIVVSGSGAILHRETVEIWQQPTYDLFFGSADEIATSADIAGLSATVAGVSVAVAGVSAAVAGVSAALLTSAQVSGIVLQGLQDQLLHTLIANSASVTAVQANSLIGIMLASADPTAYDRTSDSLEAIANGAAGGGATQTEVSTAISNALDTRLLHILAANSASVTAVNANSLIGIILASADPTAYDRATDSLEAIANGAAGGGATQTEVSTAISNALDARLLHILAANSASVTALNANSLIGIILASADPTAYNRATDSLEALANAALTSAGVSNQMDDVLTNYGVPTSAAMSAMVSAVVQNVSMTSASLSTMLNAALVNYDVATSADVSVIVQAVVPTSGEISGIVQQALSDYGAQTSAGLSAQLSTAFAGFGIPTSGAMSAMVQAVVPTSAEISGIVAQGLTDYAALVSANLSAGLEAAVFQRTLAQPTSAPSWAAMPFDNAMEWMVARSLNRHAQTGTEIEIFTSGGAAFASASVDNNSVSAIRDQWI